MNSPAIRGASEKPAAMAQGTFDARLEKLGRERRCQVIHAASASASLVTRMK